MITAVVTIPLPKGYTREQYAENAQRIAKRFRIIPGLVRMNFLFSAEEGVGGGVYLWQSRVAAEACYAGVWRQNIVDTFGVEPRIVFYETPVVVDNVLEQVFTTA